MMRLVRAGLMFGNLYEVRTPALVERYNRALEHLTGKRTALTEFHIDIVGASPEIADELNDPLYLNPMGCNQMFILLSTDQKTAPLLNNQFSTSRSILRRYIEENEDQLFALTAREAVAGELLNSIFEIDELADLLDINQIEVTADTTQSHVAEAKALTEQIDRFMSEDDAWWDDVLIAEMIEMAKRTGNIQSNPVALPSKIYEQGNYYTSHFGGAYVFRDADTPTMILRERHHSAEDLDIAQVLTLDDRTAIADWLRDEELSELIVQRPNQDRALIIRQKMDFIVVATAADQGHDLSGLSRQNMRALERRYASKLPEEYKGLMSVWRWASLGGRVPKMTSEHPAYFYALRGSQHPDRDLVNMLLTDLSRLDFRQLFICHKSLFYDAYRTWTDPKRDFVVRFLSQEYAMDKAGAREALLGPEPSMEEDYAEARASKTPEPKEKSESEKKTSSGRKRKTRLSPWLEPGEQQSDHFKRSRRGRNLREELDWDRKDWERERDERKSKDRKRRKRRDDDDDDDDRRRSRKRRR